jgi:integrase
VVEQRLDRETLALLMLGLRPSEALGLGWEHVDLDAGSVKIHRPLRRGHRSRLELDELKTKGSRRSLALPEPVVVALRGRQARERLAGGPAWSDEGLVFTTEVGTWIEPRNFRRSFDALTTRAGLGRWHPHELRHSMVSFLSAADVQEEDVADVAGHSTTRVTHRVRVSPTIDSGKAAMERMFSTGGQMAVNLPEPGLRTDPPGAPDTRPDLRGSVWWA